MVLNLTEGSVMFSNIVKEVSKQFELGGKGESFVQLIVSQIIDKKSGGVAGFVSSMYKNGLANELNQWISGEEENTQSLKSRDVLRVFGAKEGMLEKLSTQLEIDKNIINGAIGFALPKVISVMSPDGIIPSFVSGDIYDFIEHGLPQKKSTSGVSFISSMFGKSKSETSTKSSNTQTIKPNATRETQKTTQNEVKPKEQKTQKPKEIKENTLSVLKVLPFVVMGIGLGFILNSMLNSSEDKHLTQVAGETHNATTAPSSSLNNQQIDLTPSSMEDNLSTQIIEENLTSTARGTPITPRVSQQPIEKKVEVEHKVLQNELKEQNSSLKIQKTQTQEPVVALEVKKVASKKVYFGSNEAEPQNLNLDDLNEVSNRLKINPNAKVALEGYHDKYGDVAYSQSLSNKRASNIKQVLVEMGVNESQIILSTPKLSEGDYNRARRVDVNVIE